MHALRNVHAALRPGGSLLDMHPVPPSTRVQRPGAVLGEFEDEEFFAIVAATEAGLEQTGAFTLETELEFDWIERYDSGAALLDDVKDWNGCRVPRALARAIREAEPPVDLWERVVLRSFRAV